MREMIENRVSRRRFVAGAAGALATGWAGAAAWAAEDAYSLVAEVDRARIVRAAERYLGEAPVTVTAAHSQRSQGGAHDYFSEGDYWWPDLKNPGGPYIRRDGFSNPDNFNDHREALIRMSVMTPALAAAWRLTRDKRYLAQFVRHLRAWFVDPATKMNPEPGVRAGDLRREQRPRDWHHRHAAPGRGGTGRAGAGSGGWFEHGGGRTDSRVVRGVRGLDGDVAERQGRGGGEEQSRRMLGAAGRGVFAVCEAAGPDRAVRATTSGTIDCAGPDCQGRKPAAGAGAHQAIQLQPV